MTAEQRAKAAEERKMRQAAEDLAPDLPTEDEDDEGTVSGEEPDLQAEIDQLRAQLSAMQGRVAPSQQQASEFRRLWESEQEARRLEHERASQLQSEIEELRSRLDATSVVENIEDSLPEELRDVLDAEALRAVATVANTVAKRAQPKVDVKALLNEELSRREEEKVNEYRTRYLTDPNKGLSNLHTLASRPEFQAWTQKEENDDFDVMVTSFLQAKTREQIDRYGKAVARRVEKFNASRSKNADRSTDPKASLAGRMRRTPQSLMGEEERQKILRTAKALARSRTPGDREKAQELLNSIS